MKKILGIVLVLAVAAGAAVFGNEHLGDEAAAASGAGATQSQSFPGNVEYDGRLVFVRIRFDTGFGPGFGRARGSRGEPPWAHDYPTSDTHLMKILKELTVATPRVDASNVFRLDDPQLFDYPIAYVSEPGYWTMSDAEAKGLRDYLLKGGFIIFDDFRNNDYDNLEEQMKRVLPEHRWVELEHSQTVFNAFFEIKNFDFGYYGKETYFGIFEDNDPKKRLIAIAGHNQDLGEFWEFSDTGMMPVDISNEAYKFGVNYFIYGLTH
ncbi:MAG TPA: DUF4159 domain-containing protein [Vicinamibacterales bacterium]|nr:DUF4159 domain-containing protein [Vicinamibacterales bacterium]